MSTTTVRAIESLIPPHPPVARPRILVAEDNESMLSLIARHLRVDGYDVIEVRNGLELMQWVDLLTARDGPEPRIDLIVTDLRMPICSGQECLDRLKSVGDGTPVIMITAFGDEQVHERAYASGARAVFDKPLNFLHLRNAIRAIL